MNVLVIAPYVPMPDRQADMLRLFEMLRIAANEHSISLLATDVPGQLRIYGNERVLSAIAHLQQLGIRFCDERQAMAPTAPYQVLVFEYYRLALSRMERMRFRFPHAVMVIDTVDINYLRLASQERANRGTDRLSSEVEAVRDAEVQTYAKADLVIAVSEDEKRRLSVDLPGQNLHVVPLIIDVPAIRPSRPSAARILFVGNFDHQANVDAARFLADRIMPIVRQSIPAAHLMIVGNRPPSTLVSDPSRGIEVTGFVPDLAPFYRTCDIGTAPLTWGGGLKGKVAEAMANGLPVVTTSVGAAGFDLRHRVHALVADTAAEFAAAIVELHENPALHERIRSAGRSFVDANYSWTSATGAVGEMFAWTRRIEPARLPRARRFRLACQIAFHRHVGWRRERNVVRPSLTTE